MNAVSKTLVLYIVYTKAFTALCMLSDTAYKLAHVAQLTNTTNYDIPSIL